MTRTKVGDADPGGEDGDEGPEELADWLAAGYTTDEAEGWRYWRIGLGRAAAWKAAGVLIPVAAARWSAAGVGPQTVGGWRAAGVDAAEAVRWHELGFGLEEARQHTRAGLGPEEAYGRMVVQQRQQGFSFQMQTGAVASTFGPGGAGPLQRFRSKGVDPRVMHGYARHRWLDDAAVAWATHGIEAADAYMWHALGLRPHEAGRLVARGMAPEAVVAAWWRAGVPFEEVAEWIGAGLAPEEAADQRARGVTVEQARALRALRADEDESPLRSRPPFLDLRFGPPGVGARPPDEEAARAEVADAFSRMTVVDDAAGCIPTVEGSANLVEPLREAGRRFATRPPPGQPPMPPTVVTVDSVRFASEEEAVVQYSLVYGAARVIGRVGRAVLVDGRWKVARDTLCDLLSLIGVACPPPEA